MTDQNPNAYPPAAPAGYTPYPAQKSGTNVLAIIALVGAFIIPLAGVICGHIALSQIKRTGESGRGLALAGLIIGYVYIALIVLFTILAIVAGIAAASAGYSSYSY
ncbi:hypothetical protein LLS1_38050 [Leifsonia sp. LS1]|uniref:DUF4190 domain-containing protein n=1 Tax=unclassified Leifsonia TaxID=2663824 RepID=UPI001CBD1E4A|nr:MULTISPECIES: DUF4190 domain-containing protein [unclassified Leifsonia]UAJ80508.1 DUF4190 domain-containing protein [Leifsonia sp. ZF2019]GIT82136.1 hypothetical protein LLS1_38050 [Leifsonia sp. LS1]